MLSTGSGRIRVIMINNDDDKERAAGGGKQQRRSATELDVAAICKIVTQPSNEKELDFIQQILTYIDEKGGPNVILLFTTMSKKQWRNQ